MLSKTQCSYMPMFILYSEAVLPGCRAEHKSFGTVSASWICDEVSNV